MSKLIAETLSTNVQNISSFERKYSEGDTGELRLYLQYPISDDTLSQLESNIKAKGVVLTEHIKTDSRVLVIHFRKAVEPLEIISSSISSLSIETIGWQLFKDVLNTPFLGIPAWAWGVGGVSAIVIAYLLSRKK